MPDDALDESVRQKRNSLNRLLASAEFAASDRQRKLLTFLCEEEIAGRGPNLKAYTIATQTMGRPASFDPQSDSIVRVEIGRLRRTLELFYALSDDGDSTVIVIPKGSYRPIFRENEAGNEEAASPKEDHGELSVAARATGGSKTAFAIARIMAAGLIGAAFAIVFMPSLMDAFSVFMGKSAIESDRTGSTVAKARQLIVVPIRVESVGSQNLIISDLLHIRLTERLSASLPRVHVTNLDRSDNQQDIDLVLRTTIRLEATAADVSFLIVDAAKSDVVAKARFSIDLFRTTVSNDGDLVVKEISDRVVRGLLAAELIKGSPLTDERHGSLAVDGRSPQDLLPVTRPRVDAAAGVAPAPWRPAIIHVAAGRVFVYRPCVRRRFSVDGCHRGRELSSGSPPVGT